MFRQSITFCLFTLLLRSLIWTLPGAAPVPVRFVEGAVHGFLVMSTTDGEVIASGDLRQISTSKGMESRTIFHFKDGSFSEETIGGIYFPWLRKKLSPTILTSISSS